MKPREYTEIDVLWRIFARIERMDAGIQIAAWSIFVALSLIAGLLIGKVL